MLGSNAYTQLTSLSCLLKSMYSVDKKFKRENGFKRTKKEMELTVQSDISLDQTQANGGTVWSRSIITSTEGCEIW